MDLELPRSEQQRPIDRGPRIPRARSISEHALDVISDTYEAGEKAGTRAGWRWGFVCGLTVALLTAPAGIYLGTLLKHC